jgi:riboflavin kinase/FMN adenylyltransferase
MQHLRSLSPLHLTGAWVTIGSFDGVHRGHQALIRELVDGARAAGRPSVVVTFFPHPAKVLRGLDGPFYLTHPDRRAELLTELGVNVIVTLDFTRELAALSAEAFMEGLAAHLGVERLLVGQDFALGRGREGTVTRLTEIGRRLGYSLGVFQPVLDDQDVVSSSQIRALLQTGEVARAARLLGRCYRVQGKVVPGDGRGRTIGIPTANLSIWDEQVLPAGGVYATRTLVEGILYPSVTNIGFRPTFENGPASARVETHVLELNRDLYGLELDLEFVERLRPEKRFPSVDDLIHQIHSDIQRAREVLAHVP